MCIRDRSSSLITNKTEEDIELIDKNNENTEPIQLTTGRYMVGEDIPLGKSDIVGIEQGNVCRLYTSQNKQCAILASFEITIYDSKSTTKARQLVFHAAELMRQMGFTMKYGPTEIDRASTTEAYRWIARFRRTYCEGDII